MFLAKRNALYNLNCSAVDIAGTIDSGKDGRRDMVRNPFLPDVIDRPADQLAKKITEIISLERRDMVSLGSNKSQSLNPA